MDMKRGALAVTLGAAFLALVFAGPRIVERLATREAPAPTPRSFGEVAVTAKAAYVYDVKTGETLFSKNAEIQLPLASLTKLMTALVAAETLEEDAVVTIGRKAILAEGDSGFTAGEKWRLADLIDFTLLTSSNDGAQALAAAAASDGESFSDLMTERSKTIGLAQTYFTNASGLDQGTASGGYGSARDVAVLFSYILANHPGLLNETTRVATTVSSLSKEYRAKNTNTEVGGIPGLIGSKTGFTDLAGGNLAVAFDTGLNHPVIVVALASTAEGRFEDVVALADAARDYLSR